MQIVPFQEELCPAPPNVYGTLDYREFRNSLIKIDDMLSRSGLEHQLISEALARQAAESNDDEKVLTVSLQVSHYKTLRHAIRCNIARHLTSESYRLFSIRLADSLLFQWFTGIHDLGSRKATSKSSLERYEKLFDEAFVANKIREWLSGLSEATQAEKSGLKQPINISTILLDSTCLKANIHFPVDWVLLRDAARSLLLAIKTIRAQGLKHRMIEPSLLLKEMNKLCIAMTHARRKKDSKKQRKKILRLMKKLTHRISKHAANYRQLLLDKWSDTEWTEKQMKQVICRLDNILEQLPAAIKQAHDRIIGERVIPSPDKILSLYDRDAHVIVRGKAGSEVEFGQGLLIVEQKDGLIVDWELFSDQPPSDSKLFASTFERIKKQYSQVSSIVGDRGFSSASNDALLRENNIFNAIAPKSPKKLQEKLLDPVFSSLQTRRSQTEARIGIFKNIFLGKPLRSRITLNKRHAINWCVLTHNLWVLSRMVLADEQLLAQQALKKAA